MRNGNILILSSGVALGAYIPPLIINNQLKARGINTEFYVIENLIHQEKIDRILNNKLAFHRDFKVALTGQKLSKKSGYGIDKGKVQLLYIQWDKMQISRFLVFSGFWSAIIDDYIKSRANRDFQVDLCHLDSSVSTSWKNCGLNETNHRQIWFFNLHENRVYYHVRISDKPAIKFKNRQKRFVIHGGGWGMGTYREKIRDLTDLQIKLDIINYETDDINDRIGDHRYYMIDPDWKTWERFNAKYIFPPFTQIPDNNQVEFDYNAKYPAVYALIRNSYGIISKPGGATLLDSLSSATPIIFLEPFGDYEKDNATLWKKLGFGIDYNQWISMKCSTEVLLRMHENIQKILSKTQNILDLYI